MKTSVKIIKKNTTEITLAMETLWVIINQKKKASLLSKKKLCKLRLYIV